MEEVWGTTYDDYTFESDYYTMDYYWKGNKNDGPPGNGTKMMKQTMAVKMIKAHHGVQKKKVKMN